MKKSPFAQVFMLQALMFFAFAISSSAEIETVGSSDYRDWGRFNP